MPPVDDLVTAILLGSATFFVALSFGLLVRYRQVSQRIAASSDLGRDLWQALEQRMKKQDERILDLMGRLEVIQTRVVASAATQSFPKRAPPDASPETPPQPAAPPPERKPERVTSPTPVQQHESQITPGKSQESQPRSVTEAAPGPKPASLSVPRSMDETHLAAIRFLGEGPKSTRQLTDALKKSREHTARLMKELFEMGLVGRNAATKPFVYQLTDEGRRLLPPP